jgi:TolA-binding protein
MKLKKILAGALLAGTLTIGGASIASAQSDSAPTTSTTTARPTNEQLCQRAQNVWQRLQTFDERLRDHHDKLVELRDKAAAAGKTDLVAKIDTRLERVQSANERIVNRMQQLHDKAQGRCEIAAPDTAAL